MLRGAGRWREAWSARLPDEVGTPAGVRRPLLPRWPFVVTAVSSLWLSTSIGWDGELGAGRAVLAVVLAVLIAAPALLAWFRPAAAIACSVAVNGTVLVLGTVLTREVVSAPWFLNAAPPQLAAAYVIAVVLPGRAAAVAVGAVLVSGLAFAPVAASPLPTPLPLLLPLLLAWAAPLAVAALLGARRRDRHARSLLLVAEGEQLRLREERDRIARELHDIVAHHMSVIAVRAVSAARRIPDVPPAAVTEFAELGAAARTALGEMRQLLGVLRDPEAAEREPQPGIRDLERLARQARDAGTPVELTVDAHVEVPPATAVSAHRIVQEALSNVTRHATGAPTRVRVGADPTGSTLVVEIENDPPADPGAAERSAGAGHGLTGMRERARLLGGALEAGPRAAGGFAVRAQLPLEQP